MRARALRDDVQNALDFLFKAELVRYTNPVALGPTRVSWDAFPSAGDFLISRRHTTVEQYLRWVRAGAYSAVLRDASLLQLTYDVIDGVVTGHRLAYVPCPVAIDEDLLEQGEPIEDVVALHLGEGVPMFILRSPVRFDFDAASPGSAHPSSHFSIN